MHAYLGDTFDLGPYKVMWYGLVCCENADCLPDLVLLSRSLHSGRVVPVPIPLEHLLNKRFSGYLSFSWLMMPCG